MENLKSLADQLREELTKPGASKPKAEAAKEKSRVSKKAAAGPAEIVQAVQSFDNSNYKAMVHVRFDTKTVDLMNRFKLAAGVDVTKLVAFAVHHLFDTHPELKQTIKHYLQNLEL
ncbi:hypothetical protein [Mucilaginibacter lacusdianchii]|uniref:hypothetical protein n=1 Tax=Mucilaginibacter lacusdianchii TaxID=2684211 RepID=UPI00131DC642|nr:hypothetical protein [Mucilaginibacter sp. JXJ CY 39]